MLALGTAAPEFSLPDANGEIHSLRLSDDSAGYLVMFICNHCPFVKHVREQLALIGKEYTAKGIGIFAINSNDAVSYPGDSPQNMKQESETWGYSFPYLIDEEQRVAMAYRAACTPDFFLFDRSGALIYRGQLDSSRPSNDIPVTGEDLRGALDALLDGSAVRSDQVPSIGCSIKWKPGIAPDE
jgi:thiol-disulfide isomerase/thioredoxin